MLVGGGYDAVRFHGERYPVKVEEGRRVTVSEYRYTATLVAENASAYGARLRETRLFALSGLSDAERDVVDAAVGDTYYAESTSDDAFRSVLERFRRHEAVDEDEDAGVWVVRYDGTVYWAELRYDGFSSDEDG
jgi:hypothetical protein